MYYNIITIGVLAFLPDQVTITSFMSLGQLLWLRIAQCIHININVIYTYNTLNSVNLCHCTVLGLQDLVVY